MELRILPGNVANMIAAGEVVQRPASVVKELLENAVDAGADQITVVVLDAGRTLVQVIDNGCGMNPDDAVLCFERHATSKIATAEDLEAIGTFGFRGEALASIAAVADVTLRTRRAADEVGVEVEFSASQHLATRETSCPQGSSFAVRNLFYNVPARRKFLKSDNVELKHIIEEFTRVALTRPDIAFTLTHNKKDLFVLRKAQSLKFRIQDLMGTTVAGELVDVSAETSVMRMSGFVGRPDTARKTLGNQFFFVNGRYFRSAYLHKAVKKAYENLMPEDLNPSYFLYLEVDPHSIDVNIHPTKTEIKFEEDNVIFQIIYACIKETLGRSSFAASLDFEAAADEMPVIGKHFDEYRPVSSPAAPVDPDYNPFEPDAPREPRTGFASADYSNFVDKRQDYGKLFEESTLPTHQLIVLQGKYIVTQGRSGLMTVHIRRAWERILFERFRTSLAASGHVSQAALFPVPVEVGPANVTLFEENAALLASMGFDIQPFGPGTVVVNGVPEGFSAEAGKVEVLVGDLLLILSDGHTSLQGVLENNLAEKFARAAAGGMREVTSPTEAGRLVDALMNTSNPEQTPSGKRILTFQSIVDIDKLF
ncbi:MAG: DNA mismatch repair endonuclease MutL [Bacteroidales bacterium]|nr:DNA mismatch repair endonuclease MutL [Bacteroidales bacterium]